MITKDPIRTVVEVMTTKFRDRTNLKSYKNYNFKKNSIKLLSNFRHTF